MNTINTRRLQRLNRVPYLDAYATKIGIRSVETTTTLMIGFHNLKTYVIGRAIGTGQQRPFSVGLALLAISKYKQSAPFFATETQKALRPFIG
ncbi:hypothetical protein NIASO_08120 [Niabella soli DSM 19437]|uniref:Uncharacterized protein n=1 Tax=Niabella soli DSM 19437 TaxID=929713 RepID=W0F336_9BACT|nr:hypothetical protein NIASO_08120 [Niabella soli DSM 19437]